MNDPADPHANKLRSTLESFGLVQHVNSSTHEKGNTLDLVITRSDLGVHDL